MNDSAPKPATGEPICRDLDVTGLNCPLPILKTRVALRTMAAGERIRVRATDPHSEVDFKAYCARSGHELLEFRTDDDVFEFLIRSRGPDT
ncbi:MAG: sulfurtransferase TusA family protein [Gammaproteobacteria bacterium]|nr:sulfurtransferase TusA family protein [Gammaproteobacteria bacterium]